MGVQQGNSRIIGVKEQLLAASFDLVVSLSNNRDSEVDIVPRDEYAFVRGHKRDTNVVAVDQAAP